MEPIAIIGFSFRLPQDAEDSCSSFWQMLEEGRNVMTEFPASRMNIDAFHDPDPKQKNTMQARGAHFLKEDPALFDPAFFSITANEAAAMDPQQRNALETSYRALENAGISLDAVSGSDTSVFEASISNDYDKFVSKDADSMPRTTVTGVLPSIISNRLSWFFNLRGTSMHIDTACSSSMVAMDLACQSLYNRDSSMAMVVGSNYVLGPDGMLILSGMHFLSPDSLCYSFDERANGYARGEGTIVMILKRLTDACKDGDMIRAVIRATGSNQDGHTPGLTQPSSDAQENLIRSVYRKAGLGFEGTHYIEAHGTGTPLGDPLEMRAIGRVFRTSRSPSEPLYVGSIKANIGHLEGASGLAGILKSILILEKGVIPPNALFKKVNPELDIDFYNTKIPQKCIEWPTHGLRRISVNSFGLGGSNSHLILDDAFHYLHSRGLSGNHCTISFPSSSDGDSGPVDIDNESDSSSTSNKNLTGSDLGSDSSMEHTSLSTVADSSTELNGLDVSHSPQRSRPNGTSKSANACRLLVFSAANEATTKEMFKNYSSYYQDQIRDDQVMTDKLAFTLSTKRSSLLWRSFALANPLADQGNKDLQISKPVRFSNQIGTAFIFTGQGAQYAQMGLELLCFPVFKDTLSRIDKIFAELGCEWSVFDEIENLDNINRPEYSQPLCTALQISLVELLKNVNIVPAAVAGHSSGEIAAAYTSGALSIESACKVAYYRGLLAGKLVTTTSTPGAMISVNLAEDEVADFLKSTESGSDTASKLTVACINSPTNVTLSGDEIKVDALKEELDKQGVFAHKLKTGVAYHSSAMEVIAAEYKQLIGELKQSTSKKHDVRMISTITGTVVTRQAASQAEYWATNLVSPVRFTNAINAIISATPKLKLGASRSRAIYDFVEVGPHSALRRPCLDILKQASRNDIRYISTMDRNKSSVSSILELVGKLWTYGYPVAVNEVNKARFGTHADSGFLVDTPQYPFDHSQAYWSESRLSRSYRTREPVPRKVLGTRCQDWNPLEPKWRKFISLQELPWVADHVVSGSIVYPATGSLIMALEAVKQVASTDRPILSYYVKEAVFSNPIILRAGQEGDQLIEAVIALRPIRKPYEKESTWSEVWISTHHNGTWTECFRATIQTQYQEIVPQTVGVIEQDIARRAAMEAYEQADSVCTKPMSREKFYKYLTDIGLSYGKAFAILEDIRWDGGDTTIGYVDVSGPASDYQGLVHPAIIDAASQTFWTAPSNGLSEPIPTVIPHRAYEMYISASCWKYPQTSRVRMLTTSRREERAGGGLEGTITALADDGTLLCSVQKIQLSPIAGDDASEAESKQLLYGVEWRPCLSTLDPAGLLAYCKADEFTKDETSMIEYSKKLDRVIHQVLKDTFAALSEQDRELAQPHLQKYISCLEPHQSEAALFANGYMDKDTVKQLILDIETVKPEWKVITTVAQNLPAIIRGEVDALALLFSTDLVETFYADKFTEICDTDKFRAFTDLLSHQNSDLKILEVGAGTGGFTSHALSALQHFESRNGGSRFSEYMYTDISHAFFEKAKAKFQRVASRMDFKVVDLERDVTIQAIKPNSYDVVIAGSVLHATKDLSATLKNLHRALKPGGKLIIFEVTTPAAWANFCFGILPGWWNSSEAWRANGPIATEEQWDKLLKGNNFSGNDLVLRDYKSEDCHSCSLIVTTAERIAPEAVHKHRILLVVADHGHADQQVRLAETILKDHFSIYKSQSEIMSVAQLITANVVAEDIVIFLAEFGDSMFRSMTESQFKSLQNIMLDVRKMLWVMSSDMQNQQYADFGMTYGFLRTMRSEASNRQIITLGLEGIGNDINICASKIAAVFTQSFECDSPEVEYILRDGQVMTGRLVEEAATNNRMLSTLHAQLKEEPWQPQEGGTPLMLTVGTRGNLDTIRFVEDAVWYENLGPKEVEVEAIVWGLNFRDVFNALGRIDDDNDFGFDCGGRVTRVGVEVTSVVPGDRVCMASPGCMRMYARGQELEVIKIPDCIGLSLEEIVAATAPTFTAYYSLVDKACLQKGEKILIHSAAGATGQLAVAVAQMLGAEVFATVGMPEKKLFLEETYGIPADHIFYSRNTSFAHGIRRMTNGYGVDVVLNSLSGDGLRASWECMAPYGRFIEIGKVDIQSNSALPMSIFAKNVTFAGVDLHHVLEHKPTIQRLLQKTMELLGSGAIQPPRTMNIYPVSGVEDAFRYLQSGKNTGRIVITNAPSDIVPKFIVTRPTWMFDEKASYLIAGGLGGIGRAICRWMMRKGAKHLILSSRRGVSSQAAVELVAELKSNGVNVFAPPCDVSSVDAFSAVLSECSRTMPPIKGCINAVMDAQDAIFEKMTYALWEGGIRSKVQTSWNLHSLLPENLDFFIMLSSLAGIYGSVSQSNYAAGNTYQDTLAQYRTFHGQKATALDLGWMRTIGIIAENEEYQRIRELSADMGAIEEDEFMSLLDIYCDPACPVLAPFRSQLLVGVLTPRHFLSKDISPPAITTLPLFSSFARATGAVQHSGEDGNGVDLAARFRQAETEEVKAQVVTQALATKLARALSMTANDIDSEKKLFEYGVDSLVAVELRNWIGKEFSADVPVFDIMGGATITGVGALVTKKSSINKS